MGKTPHVYTGCELVRAGSKRVDRASSNYANALCLLTAQAGKAVNLVKPVPHQFCLFLNLMKKFASDLT